MILTFNDVNRKGTVTWTRCNDNSKSSTFRDLFVSKHGGSFTRIGKYWEWSPSQSQIINIDPNPSPSIEQPNVKTWIFKKENGDVYKTTNLQEFCKQNNLTRSSVYEVISGNRRHHKGFFFVEIIN